MKGKNFQKTVSLSPGGLRSSSAGRLYGGEGKQNRKSKKRLHCLVQFSWLLPQLVFTETEESKKAEKTSLFLKVKIVTF